MELQKSKRRRELGDLNYEDFSGSENLNVKKQHIDGKNDDGGQETTGSFNLDLSLGVFDFPWLKESLISKSEDWKFEDVFFTSLNGTSAAATLTTGKASTESSGQLLCFDPGSSFPDPFEKTYEANMRPQSEGEGPGTEGMDCIWSYLLNQPLHQGRGSSVL